MKKITLSSEKDLKIYMNPQRQKLMRIMEVKGEAMTPKQLSLELKISPSAVTSHIKKLEELGLVELDHTEKINGIQAKYYQLTNAEISLRANENKELYSDQEVLLNYLMNENWSHYLEYMKGLPENPETKALGDFVNGVAFLKEEDVMELKTYISTFLRTHKTKEEGTIPWNTTLLFFPEEK